VKSSHWQLALDDLKRQIPFQCQEPESNVLEQSPHRILLLVPPEIQQRLK
jgi:hypothetical protein